MPSSGRDSGSEFKSGARGQCLLWQGAGGCARSQFLSVVQLLGLAPTHVLALLPCCSTGSWWFEGKIP